ncbi:MAG: hypothetical protein ABI563_17875 [Specibacter sp.]
MEQAEQVEQAAQGLRRLGGKPLERGGEMGLAAVVLEPGTAPDEAALRAFCRERMAGYKVPVRIVQVDGMHRSMLGKIRGKILRKPVKEKLLPTL